MASYPHQNHSLPIHTFINFFFKNKMTATQLIFYILSAIILGGALLSVTTTKIFRSAIWLLLSLVGIAGLYFWLQVQFIAAVQIVVYVGGIVVIIIFSIFLTQQSGKQMKKAAPAHLIASALAVAFGFALVYNIIMQYQFAIPSTVAFDTEMQRLGTQMLSTTKGGYILSFEVVSILLLAAMIGCIIVATKNKPTN
jgi:NADH-quinone oxidoreductase subunit J